MLVVMPNLAVTAGFLPKLDEPENMTEIVVRSHRSQSRPITWETLNALGRAASLANRLPWPEPACAV